MGPAAVIRIAIRLIALVGLLAACVVGHYLATMAVGRSDWPRRFLGLSVRIVGADVRIHGDRAASPVLIVANHVSWLDILVIAGETGSAFVAHNGLAQQPLLRWLCQLNRTIFIARNDRGTVARQTDQLRAALAHNDVLTIFLEGTTGDGVTLGRFKSSLLAAIDPMPRGLSMPGGSPVPGGLSVQPVLIDYGCAAVEIAWTDDEPGLRNFLRILARSRRLPVTLWFLAPLAGAELHDRKTMAAAAEQRIRAAGNA